MATKPKGIPTLEDLAAWRFELNAQRNLKNKGTIDFKEQIKIMNFILDKANKKGTI